MTIIPHSWESWWAYHRDALLDGGWPGAADNTHSGAAGPLTGRGRRGRNQSDPFSVINEVVPALQRVLRNEDHRLLRNTAPLALARAAPPQLVAFVRRDVGGGLSHDDSTVATSSTLALGVLGSSKDVPLLQALMADASAGRQAIGQDRVPSDMRAYAAVALGLAATPDAITALADIVRHADVGLRDLRVCAATALGLVPSGAARDRSSMELLRLLDEDIGDDVVAARIPVALAHLDEVMAVPRLLARAGDDETPIEVRRAAVSALGILATSSQPTIVDGLTEIAAEERDAPLRHAALLALGTLSGMDTEGRIRKTLTRSVRHPDRRNDQAWAVLAAGLHGRERDTVRRKLAEAVADVYGDRGDPSLRGACAIALGLLGAHDHEEKLARDLTRTDDDALRGPLAIALALLGHSNSAETVRDLTLDPATSPRLQDDLIRALALYQDPAHAQDLVTALEETTTTQRAWTLARALGRLEAPACVPSLVALVEDETRSPIVRGYACEALGLVVEQTNPSLRVLLGDGFDHLSPSPILTEIIGL